MFPTLLLALTSKPSAPLRRADVVADFVLETRQTSAAVDDLALAVMKQVHVEVNALWPTARLICFGSRATGLAGASSDIDVVITGVPGLDVTGFGEPPHASMAGQVAALKALLPRLSKLPAVSSAAVNRSAVPVIALVAEVSASPQLAPLTLPPLPPLPPLPLSPPQPTMPPLPPAADGEAVSETMPPLPPTATPAAATPATAIAPIATAGATAGGATAGAATRTTTIHIDLSIHTPQHRGLVAADHVRWLHQQLPALAPLVTFLKALLHRHGLKASFTGGLSSYALVSMVSRFLLDRHALRYQRPEPPLAPAAAPPTPPGGQQDGALVAIAVPIVLTPLAPLAPFQPASDGLITAPCSASTASSAAAAPRSDDTSAAAPAASPPAIAMAVPVVPRLEDDAYVPVGEPTAILPTAIMPSLGSLLVELLSFYGTVFDPAVHAILGSYGQMCGAPPPGRGIVARSQLRPLLDWDTPHAAASAAEDIFAMDALVIVDPVDLRNNTSKACYRVGQIQRLFASAAKAAITAAEAEALAVHRGDPPHPAAVLEAILAATP